MLRRIIKILLLAILLLCGALLCEAAPVKRPVPAPKPTVIPTAEKSRLSPEQQIALQTLGLIWETTNAHVTENWNRSPQATTTDLSVQVLSFCDSYNQLSSTRVPIKVHVEELTEYGLHRGYDTQFIWTDDNSWLLQLHVEQLPVELTIVGFKLEHHFLLQKVIGMNIDDRRDSGITYVLMYEGSVGIFKKSWRYK